MEVRFSYFFSTCPIIHLSPPSHQSSKRPPSQQQTHTHTRNLRRERELQNSLKTSRASCLSRYIDFKPKCNSRRAKGLVASFRREKRRNQIMERGEQCKPANPLPTEKTSQAPPLKPPKSPRRKIITSPSPISIPTYPLPFPPHTPPFPFLKKYSPPSFPSSHPLRNSHREKSQFSKKFRLKNLSPPRASF